MNRKPLAAAAIALAVAGLGLSSPAEAKAGDVIKKGVCSKGSAWKLKASPENGRIQVEFEVDSNRVGQVWKVTLKDNAATIFSGNKTTVAPSGSFTARKVTANQAGKDVIKATASTTSTGETCAASLTF